jgi:hypothetical protein
MLPALLSLEMIGHARERFMYAELRRQFRELARGVLDDAEDERLPLQLKLEACRLSWSGDRRYCATLTAPRSIS